MRNVEFRMRNMGYCFIIRLCVFFLIFNCSDIDGIKKKKENKQRTDILFLTLAQNRTNGNCLRKDSSTNTNYCDRRSSGICNTNDLVITNSEKTFNLSEANNLVKAVSSCSLSFINSGITIDIVTSFSEEDTIKANNTYTIIDSCEATGMTSTATLITESEFIYINGSKGRIGVAADKLYNTSDFVLVLSLGNLNAVKQVKADALSCLDGGFPQSEKDLIADLRTGKKIKALTCSTKTGASNACP